jgi:hypothetical protein
MLVWGCAQSRQARKDSAIYSSFPPFVISVVFVVNLAHAIPLATLRLCEKHPADSRYSFGPARKDAKPAKV